ncbi:MAG: hypothetical protein WAT19_05215 [Ferruginibacter sp.]
MAIEKNIQQKIDETLQSLDGIQRAEPAPYLLTRINSALANRQPETNWSKIAAFISRPVVAFALMLILVLVNGLIISVNNSEAESSMATNSNSMYEYAANVTSNYDLENVQP